MIAAGTAAALLFILIDLTGSDIDRHASQVGGIALEMLLFTVFGFAGVALAYWQPRFALIGTTTATLALLGFGATAVLTWDGGPFLFGLAFAGDAGTVAGITVLLAIAPQRSLRWTRPARTPSPLRVAAIGRWFPGRRRSQSSTSRGRSTNPRDARRRAAVLVIPAFALSTIRSAGSSAGLSGAQRRTTSASCRGVSVMARR